MIDVIGVFVLKRQGRPVRPADRQPSGELNDVPYIYSLYKHLCGQIQDNCVVVNPGRRDMFSCMHEDSQVNDRQTFRCTKPNQNKHAGTRKISSNRDRAKTDVVSTAQRNLANSDSFGIGRYEEFLVTRNRAITVQRICS